MQQTQQIDPEEYAKLRGLFRATVSRQIRAFKIVSLANGVPISRIYCGWPLVPALCL
jgi:hypothetical protein